MITMIMDNEIRIKETNRLYKNVICLGPMVRVNSIMFRILSLEYGVNTIFTEEIIVAQIPVIENLIPTQAPAAVDIYRVSFLA